MRLLSCSLVLIFLLLGACASPAVGALRRGVDITLTESGTGQWRLDYAFDQPVRTLVFRNSYSETFRAGWEPLWDTPPIVRRGGLDTIYFERPTRTASFWLNINETNSSIDGFVDFGTHGTAISTWQFALAVVTDRATIGRGDEGLANIIGYTPEASFKLVSPWGKYYQGAQVKGDLIRAGSEETYVYVGDLEPIDAQGFSAILDADIPPAVATSFEADMTLILAYYTRQLPETGHDSPTVLFNYDRNSITSGFQGRVAEDGTMVLSISGSLNELQLARHRAQLLRFFAHEAAHNRLDATIRIDPGQRDTWISEGFAEAMAFEALRTQALASERFIQREYRQDFTQCADALQRRSLHLSKGEAHYSCGNLLAIMIASAAPERDLYQVWTVLKAAHRRAGQSALGHTGVLDCLEELGASPASVRAIKTLIMEKQDDSRAALQNAMRLSGLTFDMTDGQTLKTIDLP